VNCWVGITDVKCTTKNNPRKKKKKTTLNSSLNSELVIVEKNLPVVPVETSQSYDEVIPPLNPGITIEKTQNLPPSHRQKL